MIIMQGEGKQKQNTTLYLRKATESALTTENKRTRCQMLATKKMQNMGNKEMPN